MRIDEHQPLKLNGLLRFGSSRGVGSGFGFNFNADKERLAGGHAHAHNGEAPQPDINGPKVVGAVLAIADRCSCNRRFTPSVNPATDPQALKRRGQEAYATVKIVQSSLRMFSQMSNDPGRVTTRLRLVRIVDGEKYEGAVARVTDLLNFESRRR